MILMSAKYLTTSCLLLMVFTMVEAGSKKKFDTNFVELDLARMVSTDISNYAIFHSSLPSNWKCVSINGDEVTAAAKDDQIINKRYHSLSSDEKTGVENIKNNLTAVIRLGPYGVKSQTGLVRLTVFDRKGGTSTMGTSAGGSSSSSSSSSASNSSSGNSSTIQRTGKDAYIVTKTDFPFDWQRVFINDQLVTIVYKDGRVIMLPQEGMRPDERKKIAKLREEVEKSEKSSEQSSSSFVSSLKSPVDFVSKTLGNIFG